MNRPPSHTEWMIDGLEYGHSVADTLRYLSDCADWEDERAEVWAAPNNVLSPRIEPVSLFRRVAARLGRQGGR